MVRLVRAAPPLFSKSNLCASAGQRPMRTWIRKVLLQLDVAALLVQPPQRRLRGIALCCPRLHYDLQYQDVPRLNYTCKLWSHGNHSPVMFGSQRCSHPRHLRVLTGDAFDMLGPLVSLLPGAATTVFTNEGRMPNSWRPRCERMS